MQRGGLAQFNARGIERWSISDFLLAIEILQWFIEALQRETFIVCWHILCSYFLSDFLSKFKTGH